ncbi:alpha/beta fold hydrolase [Vreelandella zhaodongensis]|uniref:alpha/beta fold hydrolase n=1 Tax=Vreelandella zhaodongensis TaxID=1176240 RepID=UPI003EBE79BC
MSYYADAGFIPITAEALPDRLDSPTIQRFVVDGYGPLSVLGRSDADRILLAHGAGAGHLSIFMRQFAATLAAQGVQVLAIDLPYMQHMNEQGRRRPPPPIKQTLAQFAGWYDLLVPLAPEPLWVGGKSMGGRVASLFASEYQCSGVVVAGYPFHPPKKPERLRLSHFSAIRCPMQILQGERDPFGTYDDVMGYELGMNVDVVWLADGDHDFKPRRASGMNQQVLIDEAAIHAASFVRAQRAEASADHSTLV